MSWIRYVLPPERSRVFIRAKRASLTDLDEIKVVPRSPAFLPLHASFLGRLKIGSAAQEDVHRNAQDAGLDARDDGAGHGCREKDGRPVYGVQQQGNGRGRRGLRPRHPHRGDQRPEEPRRRDDGRV